MRVVAAPTHCHGLLPIQGPRSSAPFMAEVCVVFAVGLPKRNFDAGQLVLDDEVLTARDVEVGPAEHHVGGPREPGIDHTCLPTAMLRSVRPRALRLPGPHVANGPCPSPTSVRVCAMMFQSSTRPA